VASHPTAPGSAARAARVWAALLLVVVGAVGLAVGASEGTERVGALTAAPAVAAARLDEAYYRCLDVQIRSLVGPQRAVTLDPRSDIAALLRASGRWLSFAPTSDRAAPRLSLVATDGPGACHGWVVQSRVRTGDGTVEVRTGTGASVPGEGPMPRPQL